MTQPIIYLAAMPWEAITAIAALATPVTIVLALRQVHINRQQVQFASITRCINEFRQMQGLNREADPGLVSK